MESVEVLYSSESLIVHSFIVGRTATYIYVMHQRFIVTECILDSKLSDVWLYSSYHEHLTWGF